MGQGILEAAFENAQSSFWAPFGIHFTMIKPFDSIVRRVSHVDWYHGTAHSNGVQKTEAQTSSRTTLRIGKPWDISRKVYG